ncbi:MAG: hypothetical protein AABY22_28720 [Nanoarchaeota archaeon]
MLKTCLRCKIEKELYDFSKDIKSKDFHKSSCKICENKRVEI